MSEKKERIPYDQRWDAIQKYCQCGWAYDPSSEFEDTAVLTFSNPECPLHGDNPEFDLPEGI